MMQWTVLWRCSCTSQLRFRLEIRRRGEPLPHQPYVAQTFNIKQDSTVSTNTLHHDFWMLWLWVQCRECDMILQEHWWQFQVGQSFDSLFKYPEWHTTVFHEFCPCLLHSTQYIPLLHVLAMWKSQQCTSRPQQVALQLEEHDYPPNHQVHSIHNCMDHTNIGVLCPKVRSRALEARRWPNRPKPSNTSGHSKAFFSFVPTRPKHRMQRRVTLLSAYTVNRSSHTTVLPSCTPVNDLSRWNFIHFGWLDKIHFFY